ncbi:hypothetical protein Pmani_006065 [Petrolisthes manimaculis]|uniref:Uncharacterized protein n=1 Tax=Petrolisthes manimaculis TaxID=1843537 RepID=A0AAE1QAJ5_9EUCA|nr:hypothetical protein Pmani_006065 [Petrolisthes manimaculis]
MSHLLGTPTVEADPEPRPLTEWERTEKWRMQQEITKRTTAPAYITQVQKMPIQNAEISYTTSLYQKVFFTSDMYSAGL